MNPNWIWGTWLTLFTVTFFVFEVPAVRNKVTGDTLSERIRVWLGLRPHRKWQVPACIGFGGVLVWFLIHIFTGAV